MKNKKSYKVALTHTRFSYTGGIEKYIYSLVMRLLDAGHEVHYLAHRWEQFDHPNLHFHKIPWQRFPKSTRVRNFNKSLNRFLDKNTYDIVHGFTKTTRQDIFTDGSGCLEEFIDATLANRSLRYRKLLRKFSPHQRAIEAMESARFQKDACLKVIPMAQFIADQILRHYPIEPNRVEVVYNGVELEHFHPKMRATHGAQFRKTHGLDESHQCLLFVGNDYKRKGLDVCLQSFSEILVTCPNARLFVAGHDNHVDRWIKEADKLGLHNKVIWLGSVREIRDPFAASDIFLFPTRYDVFGNVGLEAMATGLPALLSAQSGVSEVLQGKQDAWILSDPWDPKELTVKALQILNHPAPNELKETARSISEKYSWDHHFDRILQIYDEVYQEKQKSR